MTNPVVHLELQQDNARRAWAACAFAASAVMAGFVLAVVLILFSGYLREKKSNPLTIGQIAALKEQLGKEPDNEAIKAEIRRLDVEVRRSYFEGRAFMVRGGYLLLFGAIGLVGALKIASNLAAQPYIPTPVAPMRTHQAKIAQMTRRAIGVFALVGGGALLALALMPGWKLPDFRVAAALPVPTQGNNSIQHPAPNDALPSDEEMLKNWPAFRGWLGSGVTSGQFPTEWDGASGKNILWKSPVPLPGNNSPVVWKNQVFVAGATQDQREIYAFDAVSGKLQWTFTTTGPAEERMEDTGYAPATMATDGRRVFAMFTNGELVAVDLAGKKAWSKNLGKPINTYGHAASLRTYRGRVILQFDQGNTPRDANSALLCFDGLTGNQLWATKRDMPSSWSSPILADVGGKIQIIASGLPFVVGYDAETGKELWRAKCMNGEVTPSPIFAGGLAFVANERAVLAAIRPDGQGDVTRTHIAWEFEDNLPDIVSPVSNGEVVLVVGSSGLITCVDAKTGKSLWEQDFQEEMKSSPTIVGSTIYLMDYKGVMHLFEAGRAYKEIGKAALGEEAAATPAFVDGKIYIRGKEHLYCIGTK